ncbi:DnaD domain protein [Atopobacter sp. AH10]|uniref:DnaD domain protein n=1 Tax=Atopobacter sp. AH10 TaxID=2315861 RepID=UPI00131441F3|nr:DnaD domain protein [Atopobacter sp. AH10]
MQKALQFQPRTVIQIKQSEWFDWNQIKWLTLLYQPFIGASACQLFTTMALNIEEDLYQSQPQMVSYWLNQCKMTLSEFAEAALKIQGAGLAKVYADRHFAQFWFDLIGPLDPETFFQDDLLSSLLYETVESTHYNQLKARFSSVDLDQDLLDVTAGLAEVFSLPVTAGQKTNKNEALTGMSFLQKHQEEKNIDHELLTSLLSRYHITGQALTREFWHSLSTIHRYYGMDEIDLARFVLAAYDKEQSSVQLKKLWALVEAYDEKTRASKRKVITAARLGKSPEELDQSKTTKTSLSQEDRTILSMVSPELMKAFKETPPGEFYRQVKQGIGGNLESAEQRTIAEAIQNTKMTNEVINVCIHHILVNLGNERLNKAFFQAVLNSWAVNGAKTAEEAVLLANRKEKGKKENSKVKQVPPYRKKKPRQEKMPNWEEKAPEFSPLTDQEKAKLREKLFKAQKKLRKKEDDLDGQSE